jgi:thioredoxin-related protein
MAAIEWLGGSLADAQALAAAQQRPLFLYWGAVWCPPCNRVKSKSSRATSCSGARPCCATTSTATAPAQALAAQYALRSYPTLVLFAPDGSEITRLPCELDGELFVAAFDTA